MNNIRMICEYHKNSIRLIFGGLEGKGAAKKWNMQIFGVFLR